MRLDKADGPARAALAAIVAGRVAWSDGVELEAAGHGPALLELEAAGWVVRWGLPMGEAWTLTPWGAWNLEAEIAEVGPDEAPRWGEIGEASGPIRLPRRHGERPLKFPELIPDPRPGPAETEILRDEETGRPVMLLGMLVTIDPRIAISKAAAKPKRTGRRKAARTRPAKRV